MFVNFGCGSLCLATLVGSTLRCACLFARAVLGNFGCVNFGCGSLCLFATLVWQLWVNFVVCVFPRREQMDAAGVDMGGQWQRTWQETDAAEHEQQEINENASCVALYKPEATVPSV